jgi:hypothetical protein
MLRLLLQAKDTMSRSCLIVVGLLTHLAAANGLAQAPGELGIERLPTVEQSPPSVYQPPQSPPPGEQPQLSPSVDQPFQMPPPQNPSPDAADAPITNGPVTLDPSAEAPPVVLLSDFMGYRYSTSSLDWIPGGAEQFGMFSILWDHYQPAGIHNGLGFGAGFHFPCGPLVTDMPPRLYDFSLGYQFRERVGLLAFDLATAVRASSDFEGSARQGIRFPNHAVGFLTVRPTLDLVFGADYLDRGDIKLLPVAGLIWTPKPAVRYELVFPRPRVVFQVSDQYRLYMSGELGGGSWAIEREWGENDLASYRDFRVCVGIACVQKDGRQSALEVGYLFNRRIEYATGIGDTNLPDGMLLRLVTMY